MTSEGSSSTMVATFSSAFNVFQGGIVPACALLAGLCRSDYPPVCGWNRWDALRHIRRGHLGKCRSSSRDRRSRALWMFRAEAPRSNALRNSIHFHNSYRCCGFECCRLSLSVVRRQLRNSFLLYDSPEWRHARLLHSRAVSNAITCKQQMKIKANPASLPLSRVWARVGSVLSSAASASTSCKLSRVEQHRTVHD